MIDRYNQSTAQPDVRYLAEALARLEVDVEKLRQEIPQIVARAVKDALPEVVLTPTEQRKILEFMNIEIARAAQGVKLRQAVIEKSLTALMWAAIVGVGVVIREYLIAHGMWKP